MHHDPAMPVKMTALKHKSLELRALVQYRDQVSEPTTAQMQQYNALISPIMQVLQAVQSTLYPDPPNNGLAWLATKIHLLPFFSNTWEMRVR